VQQAQRPTVGAGQDLLSLAERILQSDEVEGVGEDRLRQAAEAIQRKDSERDLEEIAEEMAAWPESFKDLEEALRDREESKAALDAFERAAAAISSTEEQTVPSFDEFVEEEPAEKAP